MFKFFKKKESKPLSKIDLEFQKWDRMELCLTIVMWVVVILLVEGGTI